jgi:DNA-binding NarL/FixJ family response regulator
MGQVIDLVRTQSFHLLILDNYPSNRALSILLNSLHQEQPTQQVVVLTSNNSLLSAGATTHSFIPRHSSPPQLLAVLDSLLQDRAYRFIPARTSYSIQIRFSSRELEVLRLVVEDLCNLEIASQLYLSVRTVESHRRALLQKSGTRTLAGLVAWALRTGMIA